MKNLNIDLNELSNEQLTTFTPSAALLIPKIHIIEQNFNPSFKRVRKVIKLFFNFQIINGVKVANIKEINNKLLEIISEKNLQKEQHQLKLILKSQHLERIINQLLIQIKWINTPFFH